VEDNGAYLVVVRRGEVATHARLTSSPWGVTVIWDRRYSERRESAPPRATKRNRRRRDRRRPPPDTWETLGVLMVRRPEASPPDAGGTPMTA
jgi:hypothetical protein